MVTAPSLLNLTEDGPSAQPALNRDWSTARISLKNMQFFGDLDPGFQTADVVYRYDENDEWLPIFLVAQSAALRSIGRRGWGLYAMQRFRGQRRGTFGDQLPGDVLGEYAGEVVLQTRHPDGTEARGVTEQLVRRGEDRLLLVQRDGVGFEVVRGEGDPPLFRMNDAQKIPGLSNNVRFQKNGIARAIVTLTPVPPLDLVATLAELGPHELLVDYGGKSYWELQSCVGSEKVPLEIGTARAHASVDV